MFVMPGHPQIIVPGPATSYHATEGRACAERLHCDPAGLSEVASRLGEMGMDINQPAGSSATGCTSAATQASAQLLVMSHVFSLPVCAGTVNCTRCDHEPGSSQAIVNRTAKGNAVFVNPHLLNKHSGLVALG
jgi:hypothetical protein